MPRVLIVGGGPAGATAGAILARAGLAVTIIEQARPGRDKVCGECVSSLGIATLAAHGLDGALRALDPHPLIRSRLISTSGAALVIELPAPSWGLARGAMDAALLAAAREAGADLLQPARVESLFPGVRPSVQVRALDSGRRSVLDTDLLLLADGRSAFPGDRPAPIGDLGLKAHFRCVRAETKTITLFGLDGHYVGLAPVSSGSGPLWNLAASVPAARVRRFGGDHEALLATMRKENAALDHALACAEQVSDWLACPLPRFAVRRHWPAGVIPIGNAAAALEPIGGEGMGLAIASAALAAECVLDDDVSATRLAALERAYRGLWRTRRTACRAMAMALSNRRSGIVSIALAARAPILGRIGLRLIGKGARNGKRADAAFRAAAVGPL